MSLFKSVSKSVFPSVHPASRVPAALAGSSAVALPEGAVAAWSTRNVVSSYSGPVIRVRRSSDSTQADFTAAEVSDGTMLAWVGAGNGFIVTMYDQVGSKNLTQATTARQPQIVASGVRLDNPTYNGGQLLLQASDFDTDIAQPATVFLVTSRTATVTDSQAHFTGTNVSKRWQLGSQGATAQLNIYAGNVGYPRTYEKGTTWGKRVVAMVLDNADTQLWVNNGWMDVATAGTFPLSGAVVGAYFTPANYQTGVNDDIIIFSRKLTAEEIDTVSNLLADAQSITLTPRDLQVGGYTAIEESSTHYDFGSFAVVGTDNSVIIPFCRSTAHIANGGTLKQYKYTDSGGWVMTDIDAVAGRAIIDVSGGIDSTGTIYAFACVINSTTNVTESQPIYKSTDNGASWSEIGDLPYPVGQLRFSPYGPLIEWPDIGSGRRLMQPAYSMSGAQAQAGSTYIPFVCFCDPDVDDTDWSEIVNIDSQTATRLGTEFGFARVSDTACIAVGRNNGGRLMQYKTEDRGQTWTYQGLLLQSVGSGVDVSPWLFEFNGLIYCIWVSRDISSTKMQLRYCTATGTDLLASSDAWGLANTVHAANHTTGLDFCFPTLFERNGELKVVFSDRINSTKSDLLISDL